MEQSSTGNTDKTLLIMGIRGLPAAHGGFETFAQRLATFLVGRGWTVKVYCQHDVAAVTQRVSTDVWCGIERINIQVASSGPKATLAFDALCVLDAARRDGLCLVLGYNGAAFLPLLRWAGRTIMTNMDGIEWRRPKWGPLVRGWFWVNEWIAAWTSHRLVADHPAIMDHLATRRPRRACVMIPYGGDPILDADAALLRPLGLEAGGYLLVVARVEPDNSVLQIVDAFSRARRGLKLVVVGKLDDTVPYHRDIRAAASDEVVFPGAIYDGALLGAVRFHARAYLHGHMMGGTNPSLVEALWAGNAVIAHDNRYNRWTAGAAGVFFRDADECEAQIVRLASDDAAVLAAGAAARVQAAERFDWTVILETYERELAALADPSRSRRARADRLPGDTLTTVP